MIDKKLEVVAEIFPLKGAKFLWYLLKSSLNDGCKSHVVGVRRFVDEGLLEIQNIFHICVKAFKCGQKVHTLYLLYILLCCLQMNEMK